jgi:type IX secretion system PorP/SprF family membrane protein
MNITDMMCRKILTIIFLCGAAFSAAYAQEDPQLSQLHANRFFVNPAGIIGTDELFRVSFTDKEDYWGKDFAGIRPSSRFLSATQFFKKANSGVGLTVYHQNQNVLNTVWIKAAYAYHLQVGREAFLSFGINVGYLDGFISDDAIAPAGEYPVIDDYEKPNLDLGVGIEFYTNNVVAGVSVAHLPNIDINGKGGGGTHFDLHSYYYFGYTYNIDQRWSVLPMLSMRMARRSTNVDISLRAFYLNWVYFGASYRLDAFSIMAGINLGPNFSLGYAIDLNTTSMKQYVHEAQKKLRPSHEFILSWRGCILCSGTDIPLVPLE